MTAERLPIKLLKKFSPLDRLSDKQLVLLQANADVHRYQAGEEILALGSSDGKEYFLVKGVAQLKSFDNRVKDIEAGSDAARTALALLQPRKFSVTAKSECILIVMRQETVETLLQELPQDRTVRFSARDVDAGHEVESIEKTFVEDLNSNNFDLPSFPDVAMRIRKLLDDDSVSSKEVADAISVDPAIVVKLLKTCNSALYRSVNEITSCQEAVVRLGFETTRQLVNIFAMKELFNTKSPVLEARMSDLWSHSREVASIAYVLAEHTPKLNPEQAMLAGLIHDVGVIPVLQYVDRYPQFMHIERKLDEIIKGVKTRIGVELLSTWNFAEEFISVVENSENWTRDSHSDEADYADVVIVAQVHALIGKKEHRKLPMFDQIPAFKKLGHGGLTPKESQKVLLESHHRIAELKALLSIS